MSGDWELVTRVERAEAATPEKETVLRVRGASPPVSSPAPPPPPVLIAEGGCVAEAAAAAAAFSRRSLASHLRS